MPDPCNETECLVAACERRDTDVPAGLQRSRGESHCDERRGTEAEAGTQAQREAQRSGVALQVPLALLSLLAIAVPPLAVAFPIGEVLWLVTFWPAVFLLVAGIVQVRGEK